MLQELRYLPDRVEKPRRDMGRVREMSKQIKRSHMKSPASADSPLSISSRG